MLGSTGVNGPRDGRAWVGHRDRARHDGKLQLAPRSGAIKRRPASHRRRSARSCWSVSSGPRARPRSRLCPGRRCAGPALGEYRWAERKRKRRHICDRAARRCARESDIRPEDADLAVLFTERWLDWFFRGFRYGRRLPSLTRDQGPLGLSTFQTSAAYKNITLKKL